MGNLFVAVVVWFVYELRSAFVDFRWSNEFVVRTLAFRGGKVGARTYSWLVGYMLELVAMKPHDRIRSPYWRDPRLDLKHPVWAALSQVRPGAHEENEPMSFLVALAGEGDYFPSVVRDAAYREALKRAMSPFALIRSFPGSSAALRAWNEIPDSDKPREALAILKTTSHVVWIGTVFPAVWSKAAQSDEFGDAVLQAVLARLESGWDPVSTREALYMGLLPLSVNSPRQLDVVAASLKFLFQLRGAQYGRNGVVDALRGVADEVLKKAVEVVVGNELQWNVLLALYEMVAHTSGRVQSLGRRIAAGLGDDVVQRSRTVIEPIAKGNSDSIFLRSLLERSESKLPVAVNA